MINKDNISKLERIAIAENLIESSHKIDSDEKLYEVVNNTIQNEAKAKKVSESFMTLHNNWSIERVLQIGWQMIEEDLLPLYVNPPSSENFDFNFEAIKGKSDSIYWKQCICLMALWKFTTATHRENLSEENHIFKLLKNLEHYQEKINLIRDIWTNGRNWLDEKVEENDWYLYPTYKNAIGDHEKEISIHEQSIYLYARSHLAFEIHVDNKYIPVPIEPIKKLFYARPGNSLWWPNNYDFSNNNPDYYEPSLRATCLAIRALSDWLQFKKQPYDIDSEIKSVCKDSLVSIVDLQLQNGAWQGNIYDPSDEGDICTTSAALFILERFNNYYNVNIPYQIYIDAQVWLTNQVTKIVEKNLNTEGNIENIAKALPVITKNCKFLNVPWIRSAFKYLFENREKNYQDPFSNIDAWRLYSTIEILRRNSLFDYLQKIV